jgi:RNA polymerase sigma-32 factor
MKKTEPEIIDINPPEEESSSASASSERSLAPTDPVAQYLQEIRKYPVLSKEDEYEVAKKYYETRDPALAEVLVTSNLRFVVKVAAEYSRFGARLIDLVQEGNVGLMHAVKEFNPYKGVKLITYAVWWIRGYIQEYLMRQYSMVRIGTTANQRKLFYQLQKQREELERMGFQSGVKLLSGKLGIPENEVLEMSRRLSGRDVSLDQPLKTGESNTTFLDLQSDATDTDLSDEMGHMEELQILEEQLDMLRPHLNEREIFLLDQRILSDDPMTLQEIGDKYGVTREAVRQLEVRLIKKIKNQMIQTNGIESE